MAFWNQFPSLKRGVISITATFASIGFYRGCEWFHHTEIKNKPVIDYTTYACIPISGVMFASTYVNPAFMPFVVKHEMSKFAMILTGNYDEKQYYANGLFNPK